MTNIIKDKIEYLQYSISCLGNSKSDIELRENIGYQIDILQDILNELEVIEWVKKK